MTVHLTFPDLRIAGKGNLTIILLKKDIDFFTTSVVNFINDLGSHNDDTANSWIGEAILLSNFASNLMSNESKIDIFDYLPLTEDRSFPDHDIIIAESNMSLKTIHYIDHNRAYPITKNMQIKLVSSESCEGIFTEPFTDMLLAGSDLSYIRWMKLGIFDKEAPLNSIFDMYGVKQLT